MLTDSITRIERNANGSSFEDRASLSFITRRLDKVPEFSTSSLPGGGLSVSGARMRIRLTPASHGRAAALHQPFAPGELSVDIDMTAAGQAPWSSGNVSTWTPQSSPSGNLGGTISSWNEVDPTKLVLQPGLLSRDGWALVDDSTTPLFDESASVPWLGGGPWLHPVREAGASIDWYLIACGTRFRECMGEFTSIAGAVPLPPQSVLGVWWSHYEPLSEESLIETVLDKYANLSLPLNHVNLDVNWHWNTNGPQCKGFNGFDWNATLFPNATRLGEEVRSGLGGRLAPLRLGVNTHLFNGVDSCNSASCFAQVSRAVGADPAKGALVPPNLTSPAFMGAVLTECIRADKAGLDLIWLDGSLHQWQGAGQCLDRRYNLFWNVHVHDQAWAARGLRPLTMPRYAGLGQHRYTVGFSGDADAAWPTLAAEVNMTSNAAAVAFGWWSHDIGGFRGNPTPELYARWFQFGVVAPIMRSHGIRGSIRRPWLYPSALPFIGNAMRLRVALGPYLYGAAASFARTGVAFVRKMWMDFPLQPGAYSSDLQFLVGDALIARPIVEAVSPETGTAPYSLWLPDAACGWQSLTSSTRLPGGGPAAGEAPLAELPLFGAAGSLLPTLPFGTTDTTALRLPGVPVVWLLLWPQAGGAPACGSTSLAATATLYEDSGEGFGHLDRGAFAETVCNSTISVPSKTAALTCSGQTSPGGWSPPGVDDRVHRLVLRGAGLAPGARGAASFNGKPLARGSQGETGWHIVGAESATTLVPAGSVVIQSPRVAVGDGFSLSFDAAE